MGCNCGSSEWHIPDNVKKQIVQQDEQPVPANFEDVTLHKSEVEDANKSTEYASTYEQRLDLCASCDDLNRYHTSLPKGADISKLDRCSICGCFVKFKAMIGIFHCPVKKW